MVQVLRVGSLGLGASFMSLPVKTEQQSVDIVTLLVQSISWSILNSRDGQLITGSNNITEMAYSPHSDVIIMLQLPTLLGAIIEVTQSLQVDS